MSTWIGAGHGIGIRVEDGGAFAVVENLALLDKTRPLQPLDREGLIALRDTIEGVLNREMLGNEPQTFALRLTADEVFKLNRTLRQKRIGKTLRDKVADVVIDVVGATEPKR